jgi:hypothetical protein
MIDYSQNPMQILSADQQLYNSASNWPMYGQAFNNAVNANSQGAYGNLYNLMYPGMAAANAQASGASMGPAANAMARARIGQMAYQQGLGMANTQQQMQQQMAMQAYMNAMARRNAGAAGGGAGGGGGLPGFGDGQFGTGAFWKQSAQDYQDWLNSPLRDAQRQAAIDKANKDAYDATRAVSMRKRADDLMQNDSGGTGTSAGAQYYDPVSQAALYDARSGTTQYSTGLDAIMSQAAKSGLSQDQTNQMAQTWMQQYNSPQQAVSQAASNNAMPYGYANTPTSQGTPSYTGNVQSSAYSYPTFNMSDASSATGNVMNLNQSSYGQ